MKLGKISVATFDHPLVFLFFLILALAPMAILMAIGAQKLGLFNNAQ